MSATRDGLYLTLNFRLGEFAVSKDRPDLVEPVPDKMGPTVVRLAFTVLQPIRDRAGAMAILSGYRSEALNAAPEVGGSPTSQHLRAEAADFTCASPERVFRRILNNEIVVPAGQVIYYPDDAFIHAALPGERYPELSLHVHAPDRGIRYQKVGGVSALERLIGGPSAT